MSTQEHKYQVCVLFDASVNVTVRAATPEAAAEEAAEQTDGAQHLCHQCSRDLDTADSYGVHVYQNDKLVLDTTRAGELEDENKVLTARVAELEARLPKGGDIAALYNAVQQARDAWAAAMSVAVPVGTVVAAYMGAHVHKIEITRYDTRAYCEGYVGGINTKTGVGRKFHYTQIIGYPFSRYGHFGYLGTQS